MWADKRGDVAVATLTHIEEPIFSNKCLNPHFHDGCLPCCYWAGKRGDIAVAGCTKIRTTVQGMTLLDCCPFDYWNFCGVDSDKKIYMVAWSLVAPSFTSSCALSLQHGILIPAPLAFFHFFACPVLHSSLSLLFHLLAPGDTSIIPPLSHSPCPLFASFPPFFSP